MTPAQAKAQRDKLLREIRAELKTADRARLRKLRDQVRELRRERIAQIRSARTACSRKARQIPTLKEAAAILRAARAEAKATCMLERAKAGAVADKEKRARAERDAERHYQASLRRIDRHAKARKAEGPSISKATRRQESDDEVRANIPPELVALFERVKRQIHGSARMTRTEAFLKYAEEHPDEELQAIEDKTDAMIRAFKRGERRVANRRKNKAKKKAAKKRKPKRNAKRGKVQTQRKESAEARTRELFSNPPRGRRLRVRIPAAWWKVPARTRVSIMEKLARSKDPRARRAGHALVDAEIAKHGALSNRRSNPRELVSLVYLEQKKGDREPYEYEHQFEGDRPQLRMRGGALQVDGGSYHTEKGWIHG